MGDKNINSNDKSSREEGLEFVGSIRKKADNSKGIIELSDEDEELKEFDIEFVNNSYNLSDNDKIKTTLLVDDKDKGKIIHPEENPNTDLEWMKVVDILKRDDDRSKPEIPFDNNIREDRYEVMHDQNGEYMYDKKNERRLRLNTIRKRLTLREGLLFDLESIGEEIYVVLHGCDNYQDLKKDLEKFVNMWKKSLNSIDIEYEARYEIIQGRNGKYIHDKKEVKPLKLEEVKKLLVETEELEYELKEIIKEIQVILKKSYNYLDLYNNISDLDDDLLG